MKKLFILLALGGILYSCTKEAPVTPSVEPEPKKQQDAPVDITKGSGSEDGLRVSFTAEVAPFEEVAGAPQTKLGKLKEPLQSSIPEQLITSL